MTAPRLRVFVIAIALILGFGPAAQALTGGCPVEGSEPMIVGPVNPIDGFPLWVQDSTGLAVEFCPDISDPVTNPLGVCIGDPVDPANSFSLQIGFGTEGFMASAEAAIETPNLSALLVTGVELAFLNEIPADGEQFPFTRLRIRADVTEAGFYTVTHPWGREQFTILPGDIGTAPEIRQSFDISFAPSSTHQGRIGPILTWDTFNRATGTLSDSDLVGHIGDLNIPHAVTGSPCGTNYFQVSAVALDGVTPIDLTGAGENVVTETLFTVTGKVFTGVTPVPLVVDRSTYSRQPDGSGQLDVFATSAPTAGVTFSGGPNVPVGERPLVSDGGGSFYASLPIADASLLPMTISVTGSNPGNDITKLDRSLDDVVTISRAEYDVSTQTLTIEAASSDGWALPALTASGLGDLLSGSLVVSGLAVPPASVTVTSAAGGLDSAPVTIVAGFVVGDPPVANADTYSTDEDVPLVVSAAAGILVNDTDTEDGTPGNALLGSDAANGTLVLNLDGSFTYTPIPDFSGTDSFTYAARDLDGNLSSPAVVSITVNPVNDAPVAVDDTATTNVNTATIIFVLNNDRDVDGILVNSSVALAPSPTANGGITEVNAAGEVTYTPAGGFIGSDTFTYTVSDDLGAVSNTATVTVNVANVAAEVITVTRAQYRANRGEWRITGTSTVPGPGNFMDVHVGDSLAGAQIGSAEVDAVGAWEVRVQNSPVLPDGATTVTVHSTGGAVVTVPLQIR